MDPKIEIKIVQLSCLKEDQNSCRLMTEEARSGLLFSLHKFGYVSLLVVNKRDNLILSGNQRFRILKAIGNVVAPAIIVDLNPNDARALSISLNSSSISGHWTPDLNKIIEEIKSEDFTSYVNLRIDELRSQSNVLDSYLEDSIKEKELDEKNVETSLKCPECGYAW